MDNAECIHEVETTIRAMIWCRTEACPDNPAIMAGFGIAQTIHRVHPCLHAGIG